MSVSLPEQPLALRPTSGLPALRLLPVPVSEPPYDDELPAATGLAVVPAPTRPFGPLRELAPSLRLVPPLADDDLDGPAPRTPLSELPPARPVAQALVQGLLEVLSGVRPVSQLQRGSTPELFAELERTVHARPRPTGVRPRTGAVRSVHVQERDRTGSPRSARRSPRDGRAAAIALRLEGIGGRWCLTEVAGV